MPPESPISALAITPTRTPAVIAEPPQRLVLLAARFAAWRKAHPELGDKEIGRMIGYSASTVNRYCADKYTGDIHAVESAITELLVNDAIREDIRQVVEPFETEATHQLSRYLEIIRAKPQIGMAVGDAGWGKTCGIALYREQHQRTTLVMTASPLFGAGAPAIVNALWKQCDTRGYNRWECGRGEYLIERVLRNSRRLIVVDDAHELHEAGRRTLKSLHDLTGCSIALVGNPRIRQQWHKDDQQGSRVGFVGEVRLLNKSKNGSSGKPEAVDLNHLKAAVRKFLAKVWPESAEHIEKLALEVAKHAGHMRSLWLQCSLAMHLIDLDKSHGRELHTMAKERGISIQEQAFRTAHHQLVRGYELPA
jgi:DNA transposition AAA+ family ATPase